jgi:hypothetical protein
MLGQMAGEHFNWALYFQEPGLAEAEPVPTAGSSPPEAAGSLAAWEDTRCSS